MELVLRAAKTVNARLIDITGGAPELNPYLQRFIRAAREQGHSVQVRTNLTVLIEPGFEAVPEFFREHRVHLVASLPCYLEENVQAQRGADAYEKSIQALKMLNALGYGSDPGLPLDLVYNPVGPFLPPDQMVLEADYRRELGERFVVTFSRLLTITNMPIGRFFDDLQRHNKHSMYMQLLRDSFNFQTLDRLMCRHQIDVDWDGTVYDCDFNLALNLPVANGAPANIKDFDPERLTRRRIVTGNHCLGCTAGHGSSCSGALV
jgi:radical SAM/Cys-rich protein